jgi:two-component system chemotaxis sensor kinase CheA
LDRDTPGERARDEFFSEAQELIDGLSRDLLSLDEVSKRGGNDAELVNDVFRAVHTLKGLSGLFGAAMMSGLSHELEDLLDDLRLGRIELSQPVLDLLFQSVELYGRILSAAKGEGAEPVAEVKALLTAIGQVSQEKGGGQAGVVAQYELDPGLLGVLTEYEEHRLRTNLQAGLSLFRLKVQFQLSTIDSALDELKGKTRPHGEIITYLPTGEGTDADVVELEILVASRTALGTFKQALSASNIDIEEVRRRDTPQGFASVPPPRPPPSLPDAPPMPNDAPLFSDDDGMSGMGNASARGSMLPPGSMMPPAPPMMPGMPMVPGQHQQQRDAGRDLSLRSVSQTVRVDIRKLDHLMNIVGELAIVRGALSRVMDRVRGRPDMRELGTDLHRLHRAFERNLHQMQNGILEVRMVPLGQVFEKLARIVRQISREADKQVNLVITGADTEIDKLIVEELSDPLMHMMRNAIDHGIEDRDARMRVGKMLVGTIALNAFQKGNHVVIEVEDDGAGMDPAVIIAAAVRKGLIAPDDAKELSNKEALALVFAPGFTTKEEATSLSGRGVGMDIVKTSIARLGGVVDIHSDAGIGTKMTITLPITLAIISVLMIEVAGHTFAVPLSTIEEAIVFDAKSVRSVDGREVLTQRGLTLPICRLDRLLELDRTVPAPPRTYVVVATVGDRRVGFVVDALTGQRDIVIKALGQTLRSVRGFAGATELGDQRVGLVLDVQSLIDEVLRGAEQRMHAIGAGGVA